LISGGLGVGLLAPVQEGIRRSTRCFEDSDSMGLKAGALRNYAMSVQGPISLSSDPVLHV